MEELTALLREQERLTGQFQVLMDRLEQHPILQLLDGKSSDHLQSLRHSRAISQEAIEKREQMALLLRDFNGRLQANVLFLQRLLEELDDPEEAT